ncbi:MAG: hypothetical protein EOP09_18950, partial [Proteobacteria bacterium]
MSDSKMLTTLKRSTQIFGTFLLNRCEYTLPVESIQEVVNYPERIQIVPLTPHFLHGVFNLRGVIIPLVDMRKLLKFPDFEQLDLAKVAIIDFEGAKLGLLFDSTGEILHVHSDQETSYSYTEHSQKGAVKGAGHHSVVQIPGRDEWVIAYHRFIIPGGDGFNRETCVSPMRFD